MCFTGIKTKSREVQQPALRSYSQLVVKLICLISKPLIFFQYHAALLLVEDIGSEDTSESHNILNEGHDLIICIFRNIMLTKQRVEYKRTLRQGNQLGACWYRPGKRLRGQNNHHFTLEKTKAQHMFIAYLLVEGYHFPIQINLLFISRVKR